MVVVEGESRTLTASGYDGGYVGVKRQDGRGRREGGKTLSNCLHPHARLTKLGNIEQTKIHVIQHAF